MKAEIYTVAGQALDRIGELHEVPRDGVEPDHEYRLRILNIFERGMTMENSTSGKTACDMQVRIATKMVHWPTGPIPSCDKHASQLVGLARFLGHSAFVTADAGKLECFNCRHQGALFDINGRTLGLASEPINLEFEQFKQYAQQAIVERMAIAPALLQSKKAWMIVIYLDGVEHFLAIQHGNCRWTTGEDAGLRMAREADALAVLSLVGDFTKGRAEEREFF